MCGRVTQKKQKEFINDVFGYESLDDFEASSNIKPTQYMPIVVSTDGDHIKTVKARWWLQKNNAEWSTKFSTFNARTDKLESSFLYKPALVHHRCLVPVSSFYEWTEKGKPPYEFNLEDKAIALAGLWNYWFDGDIKRYSFTIITTEPNQFMQDYHNRMPVIFDNKSLQESWLKKGGMDLLKSYDGTIIAKQLPDKIEAFYVD